MRPNPTESLRGMQQALAADIGVEVQSPFGQDALQMATTLLESTIAELDGMVDSLVRDNETIAGLLERATGAIETTEMALAEDIRAALARPGEESLRVDPLSARNRALGALLERLLVVLEDGFAAGGLAEELGAIRGDAYRHLREVAARGWSFWDMLSFRERMARLRADAT
jgi:hypothetical protein